jgi:putative sigma-54 modulation protein
LLFTITGKHVEITEAIQKHAEEKTSKLPKYYDSINQIEVIVDGSKAGNVSVEIIARAEHGKIFVATEAGTDVLQCIDIGIHKLEEQLRRKKTKERDNKHTGNL